MKEEKEKKKDWWKSSEDESESSSEDDRSLSASDSESEGIKERKHSKRVYSALLDLLL